MKLTTLLLATSSLLTTIPSFAANKVFSVPMINATTCHITPSGQHKAGRSVIVVFYNKPFGGNIWLMPGDRATVPITASNTDAYAIVDEGANADEWTVNEPPSGKYIVSYDGKPPKSDCVPGVYQCLVIKRTNPCKW